MSKSWPLIVCFSFSGLHRWLQLCFWLNLLSMLFTVDLEIFSISALKGWLLLILWQSFPSPLLTGDCCSSVCRRWTGGRRMKWGLLLLWTPFSPPFHSFLVIIITIIVTWWSQGHKWPKMANLLDVDHLGPFRVHLDPFDLFRQKLIFHARALPPTPAIIVWVWWSIMESLYHSLCLKIVRVHVYPNVITILVVKTIKIKAKQ